jgi:DNA-binding MarR family transcriptional regulator
VDPPAEQQLGDTLLFMRLLWAVDHGMRSVSKRMRWHLGVTGPERLVLRMLGQFPRISAGSLASLLHVHPSTLTAALDRLGRRGLIRRQAHTQDGRRAVLRLTPAGGRVDRLRSGTVEACVERVLRRVPRRKTAAARDLLEALAEELDGKAAS